MTYMRRHKYDYYFNFQELCCIVFLFKDMYPSGNYEGCPHATAHLKLACRVSPENDRGYKSVTIFRTDMTLVEMSSM